MLWGMLQMAKEFLSVDDCMTERKRLGFARACVKHDLSRPLRLRARIMGSESPSGRGSSTRTMMISASDVAISTTQKSCALPKGEGEGIRLGLENAVPTKGETRAGEGGP